MMLKDLARMTELKAKSKVVCYILDHARLKSMWLDHNQPGGLVEETREDRVCVVRICMPSIWP